MNSPVEIHSLTWNVTPDLLGILDNNGVFIETNPSWQHTLGWEREEVQSRTFYDFLHPDDIAENAAAFSEIKAGKPILDFENRYRHKDGTYRWLSWNAVPEGSSYFCSARDITVAKKNAASLRSREQEALLREQFVAVLGHDLRNPLAAIRSAVSIMGREEQSERTSEMITAINGCVDRMAALIADIMDFARSKLGSGLELTTSEQLDPVELLSDAIDEIALANPDRTINRHLTFTGTVPGDRMRLTQLVSNLLGNAIAHGDPDTAIDVRLSEENGRLDLRVANAGEPIPADKLGAIFEPFYSADPGEHKKGLGLGLFIVSQIAKAHGGEMTVNSDSVQTVFRFSMPTHPARPFMDV
ncbi:PAS domain S-box-containing protein [Yoonia rosea]|uniref:histidine kinase n=1 Tax=Yoonia rosea TaxID=287098 RepID=A0A1R3XG55_9RHOB|nr:PAS domain-containing sensor histidine kinase [Yoonia rosea]SIT90382.1 PAS domain S-box-containing protein [Yoonia rosea]